MAKNPNTTNIEWLQTWQVNVWAHSNPGSFRPPKPNFEPKIPNSKPTDWVCPSTNRNSRLLRYAANLIISSKMLDNIVGKNFIFFSRQSFFLLTSFYFVGKKYWRNPNMFLPDRFLDHKGNIQIPDAFIPFSIGKKRNTY